MPINVIPQRIQPNTRVLAYSEGAAPGVDPGSPAGYVLPLRDTSSWQIQQSTQEAPVYALGVNPFSRVYQMIQAGGALTMGLEYLTCPAFLKWALPGYAKINLPTGAYHDFYLPAPGSVVSIGSFQIQGESAETTAQYIRGRYHRVSKISTSYMTSGAAPFDVDVTGSGDRATTDLAGTKTYNGYKATSMFNGQASLNALPIAGMPTFSWALDTGVTQFGGAFNQGVYTSINPGIINWSGNAELAMAVGTSGPEADLYFYNQAVAQGYQALRCLWADGPLNAMTSFMDIAQPTVLFGSASPKFGGKMGMSIAQAYNGAYDATASKVAASVHGTVVGPYAIVTGTTDTFSVKIDGGSTINVVFAAGTYTAAGLAALLNANGTFAAAAVADSFGVTVADGKGYLRVTSKTTGSTSSVQFQTGTAQHVGTLMGFNSTAFAGYNTALLIRVLNTSQVAYA